MNKTKKEYVEEMKELRKTEYDLCKTIKERERTIFALKDNFKILTGIIGIAIILICSIIAVYCYRQNIDENNFCLQKLRTNFPEYQFVSARYLNSAYVKGYAFSCEGTYQEGQRTERNGLNEISEETKTKTYKLLDKKDIDYLESDNSSQSVLALAVIIIFFTILVSFLIIFD